jgi:hypothetical protein
VAGLAHAIIVSGSVTSCRLLRGLRCLDEVNAADEKTTP